MTCTLDQMKHHVKESIKRRGYKIAFYRASEITKAAQALLDMDAIMTQRLIAFNAKKAASVPKLKR